MLPPCVQDLHCFGPQCQRVHWHSTVATILRSAWRKCKAPHSPPLFGRAREFLFGFEMATNLQYLTINHWYCIPSRTKIEKTTLIMTLIIRSPQKTGHIKIHPKKPTPGAFEVFGFSGSGDSRLPRLGWKHSQGPLGGGTVETWLRSSWFQGVVEEKVNYWLIFNSVKHSKLECFEIWLGNFTNWTKSLWKNGLLMFPVDSLVFL